VENWKIHKYVGNKQHTHKEPIGKGEIQRILRQTKLETSMPKLLGYGKQSSKG
jgi:hypothetical protein